jgi:excisionase family DNA binding protein
MEKLEKTMEYVVGNTGYYKTSHPNSPTDPLWTVEDVAAYLQLQPETIRSMARRGELPALKIGKVWRFQKFTLRELIINLE